MLKESLWVGEFVLHDLIYGVQLELHFLEYILLKCMKLILGNLFTIVLKRTYLHHSVLHQSPVLFFSHILYQFHRLRFQFFR